LRTTTIYLLYILFDGYIVTKYRKDLTMCRKGSFFTLLGPSDCGKTALFRIIADLDENLGKLMKLSEKIVSDEQLANLMKREVEQFNIRTPKSAKVLRQAQDVLLNGVPMPWMSDWGSPHPIHVESASGNRITDIDGNTFIDFCLGDTGAMFGHSPPATAAAVSGQVHKGITTMLPSEDAPWVARELVKRFGLPYWQVAMTATEANRYVIRICRTLTKRPKTLVFNECYHGSLDEALVHLDDEGQMALRCEFDSNPGLVKESVSRVVEFNDVSALEAALRYNDVACILAEPVMTNCGMVLPEPGYHEKMRELATKYGTYLIIDETHTFSSGPGGYMAVHGLKPDFITLGKSIAGGIPVAVYGFTARIANQINASFGRKPVSDPMGIGGTLSANAFAINAIRATLTHVATEKAFEKMIAGANRMADGLEAAIKSHKLPWSVTRCGARAEMQFMPLSPKTGSKAKAAVYWDLISYTHLYLANRGVLVTPFHNMMLVSPVTSNEDIDLLVNLWGECMEELVAVAQKIT
jgi:glutamate-1-semialdehyde 2,1-aminomutase